MIESRESSMAEARVENYGRRHLDPADGKNRCESVRLCHADDRTSDMAARKRVERSSWECVREEDGTSERMMAWLVVKGFTVSATARPRPMSQPETAYHALGKRASGASDIAPPTRIASHQLASMRASLPHGLHTTAMHVGNAAPC